MGYRLSSLDLGTAFDAPVEPLPVPGVAAKGDTPSLVILDGATRGAVRLSRLVRQPALLGLQVERPTEPVRVTVTLLVDDLSTEMWRNAQQVEATTMRHEHRHHRLLRLSVQGRVRAGILLDRRPADGVASVQRFSVVLRPDDVGDQGLLTLSLDLPGVVPPWLQRGLLTDAMAGVCVGRVAFAPLEGEVRPSLSTGRAPVRRRHLVPRRPGGFVLNPGDGERAVRLRVLPRVNVRRPAPVGRRAMLKEPLARTRDLVLRTTSGRSRQPLEVTVAPLDGSPATAQHVPPAADGSFVVDVPREQLPAFVRVRPVGAPEDRAARLDWYAWADVATGEPVA